MLNPDRLAHWEWSWRVTMSTYYCTKCIWLEWVVYNVYIRWTPRVHRVASINTLTQWLSRRVRVGAPVTSPSDRWQWCLQCLHLVQWCLWLWAVWRQSYFIRLLVIGPSVGFEPWTLGRQSFSPLIAWVMFGGSISWPFGAALIKRMFLLNILDPDLSK